MRKQQKASKKRQYRQKIKQYIIDIKSATACHDCGIHWPFYVMQFDHVTGIKEFDLWRAGDSICSLTRINQEIAKCEIVCANCHAIRTYKRNLLNNAELQNSPACPPEDWD